jgi:nucleotide-binding universal stress UspA family protein/nitrite reductase/ring-hydroxylating ferredoxin subunit
MSAATLLTPRYRADPGRFAGRSRVVHIGAGPPGLPATTRALWGSDPTGVSRSTRIQVVRIVAHVRRSGHPPRRRFAIVLCAVSYRTIVVGTDGSATAHVAETAAVRLARAHEARLVIASVDTDGSGRAEATVAASAREAQTAWPDVETSTASGEPADALIEVARERSADLLVLGNRGMTGRTAFLLGSVPDRVSHAAPCDLLIVNTSSRHGDGGAGSYRKVLLATDGSQTSLQAVRRGFDVAQRVGAQPILFYGGHPKTAEIVFREVAMEFHPAASLQTDSAAGDPADAITRAAEGGGYDLIVIGNRGMPGGRFHIGTVPNKVSHRTPTDLLIVRTTAAAQDELEDGQGAVVNEGGESVALYRDDSGVVHRISPKCTHMGCTVGWNADERTWDCPCHGSRYDALGKVIHGPATEDLARVGEGRG